MVYEVTRTFETRPDAVCGYRLAMVRVEDEAFVALSGAAYHRTLQFTGDPADVVEGVVAASCDLGEFEIPVDYSGESGFVDRLSPLTTGEAMEVPQL